MLRFEDQVERDNYAGQISYKYDVSIDALNEVIRKQAVSASNITIAPKPLPTRKQWSETQEEASRLPQARLLSWICDSPGIYPVVARYISADDFADPLYREVAAMLFAQAEEGSPDPAKIFAMFADEDDQKKIAEAFHQNVGQLDNIKMKESALKDLMINVKRMSVMRDDRDDNGFDTIKRIRKELEELEAAEIKLDDKII